MDSEMLESTNITLRNSIRKAKERGNSTRIFVSCRSLVMKTVPKVQDPLLQKCHYDQAQGMFLSTFIVGLSGNPGQQVRFKMPATVDQALHIAITVFEAEAQEKRSFAFFADIKTHRKGRGNFG